MDNNVENKKKESYLAKLKKIVVNHFTKIIDSEIKEYKDNMELKYGIEVKTKKSLADYITDLVDFNKSSKVNDDIRASKDELVNLLKDCKEQVKAALKGDKNKYDEEALDEFLDEELNFDLKDDEIGTESDNVDSRESFENTLSELNDDVPLPVKSAAIFLNMVISANIIPGLKDHLETKSDIYLKELLYAASTLYFRDDKLEEKSKYDDDLNLLLKKFVPTGIAVEDEDVDNGTQYVTPEVSEVNVSNLKPSEFTEEKLDKHREALSEMSNLLINLSESLSENEMLLQCKSIINSVLNALCKDIDSEIYDYIKCITLLTEGTMTHCNLFLAGLMNLIPEHSYQLMKELIDKTNIMINE